jgi:hypothetical protein
VPQFNSPPQPSAAGPQLIPSCAQVCGTHAPPGGTAVPQTLGVPAPPHVWGAVHVPQLRTPPQPLPTGPQFLPCPAQVSGVQLVTGTVVVDKPVGATLMFVPAFVRPCGVSENVMQYGSQGLVAHELAAPRLWSSSPDSGRGIDDRSLLFSEHSLQVPSVQTLIPLPQTSWSWSFATTFPQSRCAPSVSHEQPGCSWFAHISLPASRRPTLGRT